METIKNVWADRNDRYWLISGLAIIAAFILTVISMLGLCTEECAEGHKWRLFGFPFEVFGLIFLVVIGIIHWFARKNESLTFIVQLLAASAIGAELYFIYVQKVHIGTWCPVCLGIAASFLVLFITLQSKTIQDGAMKPFINSLFSSTALVVGLLAAFLGTSKYDAMEAAENTIKENIVFGPKDSNVEVFLFTDWACPACRKLEPGLEKMSNGITKDARLYFIDHAIHPETLNFIPYHLSFMLNNKPQYFKLRDMLTSISEKTGTPTEEQVAAAASKLGVKYNELNYADVAMGIKYFKALGEKFKIEGTPTMVIVNTETKKGKKLTGNNEITAENIQQAISTLKQQ